ncbi:serine hydrolase [Actinomadura sp. HBU206391]|uniref:serine hydrolase n=1 Tax=Actinomadura sp. HBU206391 TaxID=2731692 RepID=UPI00164F9229|nr:serine hydrolase [Actinomadura sp. HBU206391]MBC6459777.1 serine hydrolase [Actinomadura sp. HBU206391]
MRRSRLALFACAMTMAPLLLCGGADLGRVADATPQRAAVSPVVSATAPGPSPSPTPTARPPRPHKLDRKALTRALDRYVGGRPVSLVMRDLTTGITYRYHADRRFVTASCAKVDILMTLLLQRQRGSKGKRAPYRPLGAEDRRLADLAIRYSDNKATDRLWERVGGPGAVTAANRRFGLRDTRTSGGKCLDLYCWGITDTTADEQVRLLNNLVGTGGPLNAGNRAYVLGLMSKVIKEQAWGVSAAARKGDQVALKNGWQRRLAHGKLWAINSIGRVRTDGHDWLIAVMSDHHATTGAGIAVVEHVVELAAREFRKTTPRTTAAEPSPTADRSGADIGQPR